MHNVDNLSKKSSLCGEITVFLSFILILLLAMLGTVLESARLSAAKCKSDRILDNSMNYVFTQYCRPLWNDYHLLFLEGENSKEAEKEQLIKYLESCENDSLYYDDEKSKFQLDLLSLNKLRSEIENIIYSDDMKGEIFGHEVTQYMKYQLIEKEEKERKQIMEDISQLNHVFDVIDKQLKAEKQMGKWNQIMLQIIRNIEGISVSKNGIQKTWKGKIKTETVYIKQLCPAQPSQNLVGINNNEIWNSLRGKYINPISMLEKIEKKLHDLDRARREREEQEKKKEEIENKKNLHNLKTVGIFKYNNPEQSKLIKKAEKIIKIIDETEILISELEKEGTNIEHSMKQWEKSWNQKKEQLPSSVKTQMNKEKIQLDSSVQSELFSSSAIYKQVIEMKVYLKENKSILQSLLHLKNLTWGDGEDEIKDNLRRIQSIMSEIKKYHIKELTFNYKNVKLEKEENPLEAIPHDLQKGILPYVVKDISKISKKKKEVKNKYSTEESIFDKKFQKSNLEGEFDKLGVFNNSFKGSKWLKKGLEKQLNSITLSKYLKKHFKNYIMNENEKETALDYEQEYILAGKNSDEKNLEAIAVRIILMRTMFNYLYLLSDKQAVEKAYITAQGIVGFTFMEPLVIFTKQIILFIWAAEESIIDTNALLLGKEIPLWKQKSTFQMNYNDIFVFNKSFVKKKVEQIPQHQSSFNLKYENYLSFLLQLAKRESILYKTMNEIEDNIKLRYDNEFVFSNCIYGFQLSEENYLAKKFLQLPFVSSMLGDDKIMGWRIEKSKIQCYS